MSAIEVIVPDIGGATEVEVIELCVKPGDNVAVDDPLIVLESDKASMEIPSSQAGVISELKVKVGDKVSAGDLIALLKGEGVAAVPAPTPAPEPTPVAEAKAAPTPDAAPSSSTSSKTLVEVPDIGGSEGVTVIEVCVAEGDEVQVDDPLIVLESDKATMEIPATQAGKIQKLLVQVNDKVSTGSPIAELLTQTVAAPAQATQSTQQAPAAQPAPAKPVAPQTSAAQPVSQTVQSATPASQSTAQAGGKVHAGPAVRRVARDFGVDLTLVKGSGPKGRILKEDVQAFVKTGMQQLKAGVGAPTAGLGLPTVKLPDFSQFGPISRRPMNKIHQLTAENMVRSWLTVPHVTQFDEADITDLEDFRKAQKTLADAKGVKLTPLPFLLKACAYALRTYSQFNVALDMDTQEVIQKDYVHIGLAVDTPNGLVVPVIRDVDKKGLWDLARETAELAAKAKDKKLKPAEMQGGCFTISSLGSIGGTAFTPIVNTPEVAILGVSKAQMKPLWDGKQFQPRLMLPLSLSYDHRAINGADAARFSALLGELLGDLRKLLL